MDKVWRSRARNSAGMETGKTVLTSTALNLSILIVTQLKNFHLSTCKIAKMSESSLDILQTCATKQVRI